jgi:type I restriction-modification system DNA methylase subunit
MNTILRKFIDEPIFDACAAMLNKLHIAFNEITRTPIIFESLYPGKVTKALQEIMGKVEHAYFIGTVDEASLSGEGKVQKGDEVAQEAANGRYAGMMIFAAEIHDGQRLTRTEMATLTRGFNRIASAQPVVLFIKQKEKLALATCERSDYTQQWRDGEKLGKVSLLRDINCLHPHRGHIDILESIGDKAYPTFEELYKHWMKVFNSELLTKQFYNDLFEWYQWAISPETKVTFPGEVETQDDNREDIDTRIIRLITRLMFVWFIKQKDLVPASIFDEEYVASILKDFDAQSETEGNYYQAILQNLFFGTLNRPIIEDGERREFATNSKADVKNLYRYAELFTISEDEVIELFSTVPFLNCGLFECQDKTKTLDGVERRFYYDGFSRNARKKNGVFMYRAFVPNILFFHPEKGILSIFNRYVFTIEENTPQDVQVALDPELLGKVFENLLGAYNPETQETARNESGSFYTPREIVQYMVNESLVAHLKQTVGENLEPQYRQLLDYTTEEVVLTDQQKAQILHSLFTCKILDPACGSGAFPMGMLQQMVHILQQVDPDNSQWREVLLNMAVDESRRAFGIVDEEERKKKLLEIEDTFNNGLNSPDYTRKLYIIESCIHGVDIQPIAMLISRLRFFITLICEQNDIQRDKPELNFGIKTLPNLESKFVAANSLIDADIHKYNEDWTKDEVLALLKNELLAIRHRHFYTRKRNEKIRLLKEDEAKRKQIHEHINRLVGEPNELKIQLLQQQIVENEKLIELYQGEEWEEEAVQTDLFSPPQVMLVDKNKRERERINSLINACKREIEREQNKCTPQGFEAAVLQVTEWNPYDQNSVSPFLDIEWMFGVTDGFDIVIGNPPYIQLQADRGKLANLYTPCGYETFNRGGDIYCLFYERGNQLLKDGASLCFITSNKWMRAGYGAELRYYLTTKTNPKHLIDFGETHVFESATVMTNILLFRKELNKNHIVSIQIKEDFTDPSMLSEYVNSHYMICRFEGDESWVIMPDYVRNLKKKVEAKGVPLENWDIEIYRGVLTGYNKAFIISKEERDLILSNCKDKAERQRTDALIRPVLRGKDIKKYGCGWCKWLIATFPSKRYNIDDYPAVKNFLLSFSIQRLEQTGKTHLINGVKVKARKRAGGNWFETQDSIAYWENFLKPKIVYPNMTKFMPFYYDENKYYTNQKCFILTGTYMSFLTAFLNSSLFKFCFFDNFPVLFGGSRELSKIFFDKIPVLEVDDTIDAEFRELVLDIQKEYTDEKAKAIDQRIFDLYGLTKEERDAIGYIDFHSDNDNDTDDDE